MGVRGQFRVIGGPVCDQIARGDRKRSERPGNISNNFFLYIKIIGGCFGVTSPFREFASNLGDQIARGDRERSERPRNASNNFF